MGRVIAGEYDGGKISILDGHKCLYIKKDGYAIPLDAMRVRKYTLKEINHPIFTTHDRTYLIEWVDGKRSVIAIDKHSETILITGCETRELSDTDVNKSLNYANGFLVFLCWFIVFIIILLVMNAVIKSSHSNEKPSQPHDLSWELWNSDEQPSNTDVLIDINPDKIRYVDEDGEIYIMGRLYNNTNDFLRGIKINFDLLLDDQKVGNCLAGINFALRPEGVWNYRAICSDWPEGAEYALTDIYTK